MMGGGKMMDHLAKRDLVQEFGGEMDRLRGVVHNVLSQRGLDPDAVLRPKWQVRPLDGIIVGRFHLRVGQIDRIEKYTRADVLHQILSLGGKQVWINNTNGLRYVFRLHPPVKLPKEAEFPGHKRGVLRIGVDSAGREITTPWNAIGKSRYHLIVIGTMGYGKSFFLRLLTYQAILEGHELLISDPDGMTFPMMHGHPALLEPIGESGNYEHTHQIVLRAIEACVARNALFAAVEGYPESLEQYNNALGRQAARDWHTAGRPTEVSPVTYLPRILVILDEYTQTVLALNKDFQNDVIRLAVKGRKVGVNLVFAVQDATKEMVGRIRDQVEPICFYSDNDDRVLQILGCPEAKGLANKPLGRAVTPWGMVQTYLLSRERLIQLCHQTQGSVDTPATVSLFDTKKEEDMLRWAIAENDRYLGVKEIEIQLKCSQHDAKKLGLLWEKRGWLVKDRSRDNKRRVTDRIVELLQTLEGNR